MAKRKKVWGVAFYGPITRKWWIVESDWCGPFYSSMSAELGRAMLQVVSGYRCAAIPGTIQPDGSISWPKEWPWAMWRAKP